MRGYLHTMPTHQSTEVRRQEIVDCARKIIATRGAQGLTISELARAVGISDGAIYRHFRSKQEVLLALIDDIEETLFQRIEKAKQEGATPLDQLENVLQEHLSYVERRLGVSFLVIGEVLANGDRQLRQRMQAVVERYLKTVEEILREGAAQGQVNPAINFDAAALALFGLVQATVTLWHFAKTELPPTQRHQSLWQVYQEGIVLRKCST